MVDCMTDNRNRTVAEVRHAFSKCGGNLGSEGSVSYLFTKLGQISYGPDVDEDRVMEAALEAGADDVVTNDDGSIDVLTSPEQFVDVKQSMSQGQIPPEQAGVTMRPSTSVTLNEADAQRIVRLLDLLDDLDDVQEVYSNADIPDAIMARLE